MTGPRHGPGTSHRRALRGAIRTRVASGAIYAGEVEVTAPPDDLLSTLGSASEDYVGAELLIRVHGVPLGLVSTNLDPGAADRVQGEIRQRFGSDIEMHRVLDRVEGRGESACEVRRSQLRATAPPVTVVVPTRSRPEGLARCIDSILDLDYPNFDVIVVDNAPADPVTYELVAHRYPTPGRVRYAAEERPGASRARNRGLEMATTELVAFVDDDVRVDRGWLLELIGGFGVTEDVGCVTGLIRPMELETRAQRWQEQFGGFDKGYARQVFHIRDSRADDPLFPFRVGRFGSGANMAFNASVLRSIGGFSTWLGPATPARGGEDINAFLKVVVEGHRLVYEPNAIVHHAHPREPDMMRRQVFAYGAALTACLVDAVAYRPSLLGRLLAKLPRGIGHMLSPSSEKNRARQADYPRDFLPRELIGAMYGPVAYLQERWRTRADT